MYLKGVVMDSITSQGPSSQTELFAMKKATEVQEQQMSKILESAKVQPQDNTQNQMVAQLTGVGQSLDIKV
jgi:ribosomal protein L12E/L44/L45/RPP1/RPP2